MSVAPVDRSIDQLRFGETGLGVVYHAAGGRLQEMVWVLINGT
jgi:hypothetical protein